ncbi:MAG: ATP-binding protein [Tenericutes bacterium HGW-Tenericutes-6]|nr:MAG: ATP-binding protein [Tenericutes bacterium HGW-Tenericutes-6]
MIFLRFLINMIDLSSYLYDLIQNSIQAKATYIFLSITWGSKIKIHLKDNGCGMDEETLIRAQSPFYTTRTTRNVGLGIPLLMLLAEQTEGTFKITSKKNKGTDVYLTMNKKSIDLPPIGDLGDMLYALTIHQDIKQFVFKSIGKKTYTYHASIIKKEFKDVLYDHKIMHTLIQFMNQEITLSRGDI